MGTSIKVEAYKGEETTDKQWNEFLEYWFELFDEPEDMCEYITSGVYYCSYKSAHLGYLFSDIKDNLKNSKITIDLYLLEQEPDEVMYLEVKK
jgi:hypothetical protein